MFARGSGTDDSQVSDMSRGGCFFTGIRKTGDEADLGGKIKSSDLNVSRLRCLWGIQAEMWGRRLNTWM